TERARLEALHVLEMGVASASDERQLADAVFAVVGDYLGATHMVLGYVDVAGLVAGFAAAHGDPSTPIRPVAIESAPFLRRMIEGGTDVVEDVAHEPAERCGPLAS